METLVPDPSRCRFLLSSPRWDAGPEGSAPQVAMAGRSNAGKSSLINLLLGRRGLARTSSTPGRTQTINYFQVEDRLVLVDLPGYGYAQAPREVAARWHEVTRAYVRRSADLRTVMLLLDIRREPSAEDLRFADLVRTSGRQLLAVVTKCDKLGRGRRRARLATIGAELGLAVDALVATSATTGEGKQELWARVFRSLRCAPASPSSTAGETVVAVGKGNGPACP